MALRQFTLLTSATDTRPNSQKITATNGNIANPNQAAFATNALRNRQAVDRFTNAYLTETTGNIAGGGAALGNAGADVTVSGALTTAATPAGNYVIYNRKVTVPSGGSLRAFADGVHVYFINCQITLTGGSTPTNMIIGVGGAIHQPGSNLGASVINLSKNGSRSINFYGTDIRFDAGTATAERYFAPSDMFYSRFTSSGTAACYIGSRIVSTGANTNTSGTRWFNTEFVADSSQARDAGLSQGLVDLKAYAPFELFEGIIFNGAAYEFGEQLRTRGVLQSLIVNPAFENYNYETKLINNSGTDNSNANQATEDCMIQSVGFTTPQDRTTFAGTYKSGGTALDSYFLDRSSGANAGMVNYYAWRPQYQDFSGTAIQGVRVAVRSNFALGTTSAANGGPRDLTTASFGKTRLNEAVNQTGVNIDNVGNQITNTKNYNNFFLTSDEGLLTRTGARFVSPNNLTGSQGYMDWLRFRADGSIVTNPATTEQEVIHENYEGYQTPKGVVVAPIMYAKNRRVQLFGAELEARSASHNIHNLPSATAGTDIGNLTGNTAYPTNEFTINAGPRAGWVSGRTEAQAQNGFNTGGTARTAQQLFDIAVVAWANYSSTYTDGTNNVVPVTVDSAGLVTVPGSISFLSSPGGITFSGTNNRDIILRATTGFGQTAASEVVTGYKLPSFGRFNALANESIKQDIDANYSSTGTTASIRWASGIPHSTNATETRLIDGQPSGGTLTVKGIIEVDGGQLYTIRNCDVENLRIIRKSGTSGIARVRLENCVNDGDISLGNNVEIGINLRIQVNGVNNGFYRAVNTTDNTLIASGVIPTGGIINLDNTAHTELKNGKNLRFLYTNVDTTNNNVLVAGHLLNTQNIQIVNGTNPNVTFNPIATAIPNQIPSNINGGTASGTWSATLNQNNIPGITNGTTRVASIFVSGTGNPSLSALQTSRFIINTLCGTDAGAQNYFNTIISGNLNVNDVFVSGGATAPISVNSMYVLFRSTQAGVSYSMGNVINSRQVGANVNEFNNTTTYSGTVTVGSTTSNITIRQNIAFKTTAENFDATLNQNLLRGVVVAENATLRTNIEDDTNDIFNKQMNERRVTGDNVDRIGKLIPTTTTAQTVTKP